MILQENEYLLTEKEFYDLGQHLHPVRSRLGVLPDQASAQLQEAPGDVVREFEDLTEERRETLRKIVVGLACPVRLMRLHYSIADESISRQLIVWPGAGDEVVTLARNGNLWRASTNTEFGVRTLIREVLGAGSSLRRDPTSLLLSSTSALVFLGILELKVHARLYSILMSQTSVEIFGAGDVLDHMRQAVKEDFRWPLAMFEKILPVKMMESVQLEDVTGGLKELEKLELVEACDETGQLFALTEAGLLVADGVLHEVSKVALCLSQYRADGILGHDAVLLVRSSFYLFLIELAGEAGVVATLDDESTDLFLSKTMEAPDAETMAAAVLPDGYAEIAGIEGRFDQQAVPPVSAATVNRAAPAPRAFYQTPSKPLICAHCGQNLKPGTKFCPECGQVVATIRPVVATVETAAPAQTAVCPRCGNPVKSGAKFCRKCGGLL
jgi:hypothetical protein